jgi:hypothetical protein
MSKKIQSSLSIHGDYTLVSMYTKSHVNLKFYLILECLFV